MRAVLDTTDVAAPDRAEAIRDLIWSTVVRVDIDHHPEPERIFAHGAIADVGPINVCTVRSNATTIRRTRRFVTGDGLEPSIFVGLQLTGTSVVVQNGRQAILRPGDLAVYDTTTPYTLLNNDGIHQHYFRIRQRDLALPPATIGEATAVSFAACDSVPAIAASYLKHLAELPALDDAASASMANAGIELIRAVILDHVGDDRLRRDLAENALLTEILEYGRTHLGEHDLCAGRIAAAVHVSIRQLYAVLARADIQLGEWIRTNRLEACRRDLLHPASNSTTIAAIARRWGFVDPTHFGRAFKHSFGVTPKQWRDQHIAAIDEQTD